MSYSGLSTTTFMGAAATIRSQICVAMLILGIFANFLIADRHNDQRSYESLVLLLSSTIIVLRAGGRGKFQLPQRTICQAFLAFFALGLISAFAAMSLRHALFEWSSLLLLSALVFYIADEITIAGTGALHTLLRVIGALCLLYSLRLLLFYAATLAIAHQTDMHAIAIGFSNVRFLNHTQTALLPLLVLLCLQSSPRSALRIVWFCLTAFWWALLYMSQARASVLGLAVACVVLLLWRRAHAFPFLKVMICAAVAGWLVYLFAFVLLPILAGLPPFGSVSDALARTTGADPASGRLFLWARALELVTQHPWFGVGPLHFAHHGAELQYGAHPHNWVAQVAAEWGVPALLCVMFVIGAGMRALWHAGRHIAPADLGNQQFLSAFFVASVAILVDGLFSGVFVMPQSRLAIALVFGCAIGWVRSLEGQAAYEEPPKAIRTSVAVTVLVAACALVYSVAPGFLAHARSEPLSPVEKASNPGTHWPRLWEAGYF